MSTGRQTLAGAYDAIDNHEKVCAQRYETINFKIGLIFKVFAWGLPLGATITIGLAAWGMNRVFENQEAQMRELRAVKAEVVSPARGPEPAAAPRVTPSP